MTRCIEKNTSEFDTRAQKAERRMNGSRKSAVLADTTGLPCLPGFEKAKRLLNQLNKLAKNNMMP